MNKWLEILVGLLILVVVAYVWTVTLGAGFWDFGNAAWEFLKGGLLWLLIIVGLGLLAMGISDLKK